MLGLAGCGAAQAYSLHSLPHCELEDAQLLLSWRLVLRAWSAALRHVARVVPVRAGSVASAEFRKVRLHPVVILTCADSRRTRHDLDEDLGVLEWSCMLLGPMTPACRRSGAAPAKRCSAEGRGGRKERELL